MWSAIDIRRLFFSEVIWKEQSIMFYFSRATKRSQYLNTPFSRSTTSSSIFLSPNILLKQKKKERKERNKTTKLICSEKLTWGDMRLIVLFFFYLGYSLISWHLGYQFLTFKDLFFQITSVKSSGFYIRPEFEHGWEKCYSST